MTRARQAEQAEEALQKGMDQRRAELKLKAEQSARATKPGVRHQPRPKVALPRPITPLSPMAKRSVGMLQSLLEQATTENDGSLSLRVASAIERERVMAALSMLHVQPSRPLAQGSGFEIPLLPEEAKFFTRMLTQG